MEGEPGTTITCKECGYSAEVPAATAEPSEPAPATVPIEPASTTPQALIAPFSFLSGLAAVATFYLASIWVPYILSVVAIGLGVYAHQKLNRDRQGLVGAILGAAGLVFAIAYTYV